MLLFARFQIRRVVCKTKRTLIQVPICHTLQVHTFTMFGGTFLTRVQADGGRMVREVTLSKRINNAIKDLREDKTELYLHLWFLFRKEK